jgi:hypothetical protein
MAEGVSLRSACRRAKMGWRTARQHLEDPAFARLMEQKQAESIETGEPIEMLQKRGSLPHESAERSC